MEKSKSLAWEFKEITGVDISLNEEFLNKLKQRKFPLTKFIITYLDKIPNIKAIKREVILNYLNLNKKNRFPGRNCSEISIWRGSIKAI